MKRTILLLVLGLLLLTSCAQAKKSLADDIQGTWKDKDGYSIQFKSGGNGFIPGVAGKIPDTTFVYSIVDDSHIKIDFQGTSQTIGIVINGDQLTWKDALGEVVYTRVN
jgi:outer membrane lipoprotein-sorting protein